MTRIAYVSGRYVPHAEAGVHVEDRGFQFADAVYEVCEVRNGALVDEARHVARLERSLAELEIAMPMSRAALAHVMRETIRRNRVRNGTCYLQVSRGRGRRDFLFPPAGLPPTLVCTARSIPSGRMEAQAARGIDVVSTPDIRWRRCDIKTVMLLPACLAKEAARRKGAREAWFVDADGFITEGASSNAWIVTREGRVVTRPVDERILAGVTRATVIDVIKASKIPFEERAFHLREAQAAHEAFVTSASNTVMPVISIDGVPVGDSRPGPVATKLRTLFRQGAATSGRQATF
jgi:D-alanine transaminase